MEKKRLHDRAARAGHASHPHICTELSLLRFLPFPWCLSGPNNGDRLFCRNEHHVVSSYLCCFRTFLTLFIVGWKCFSVLLNPGGLHLIQQKWWCMTSKVRPQEDYGLGLICNSLETLILQTWLSFCMTSQALENSLLAVEWQFLLCSHPKGQESSTSPVSHPAPSLGNAHVTMTRRAREIVFGPVPNTDQEQNKCHCYKPEKLVFY